MKGLLEQNFKEYMSHALREPIIFGDYKNALEESEPRLYEDIQDFEAAKALFQEVTDKLLLFYKHYWPEECFTIKKILVNIHDIVFRM